MVDIALSLTGKFDSAIDRLTTRLGAMDDEEYLWEPVTGCWSLRPGEDGRWTIDGGPLGNLGKPPPDPAPFTTIAWRVGHLRFGMGGFASTRFGDGSLLTQPAEFAGPRRCCASAGRTVSGSAEWPVGGASD